jgi:hypothetical protein
MTRNSFSWEGVKARSATYRFAKRNSVNGGFIDIKNRIKKEKRPKLNIELRH